MGSSYTIPVREVRRVPPPVLLPERRRGAGIGYPQYDLYTAAVTWIQRAIAGRNWAGKVTVVLVLLSLFLHFPSYNYLAGHLNGTETNARWTALVEQSAEPFVFHPRPEHVQTEKTTFRLTAPVLAHLLRLDIVGTYLLQFALGVMMLYMGLRYCHQRTADKLMSVLFIAGLCCTYFGSAAFFDIWAQRDPFGYVFLFLALLRRHVLLTFCTSFLAAYSDERALIASALVFLFHWMEGHESPLRRAKPTLTWPDRHAWAVVAAWGAYFATRLYLAHFHGFKTGTSSIGPAMFIDNLTWHCWGLWSGLEGMWLFIAVVFYIIGRRSGWLMAVLCVGVFITLSGVSVLVTDTTRSIAYGAVFLFPAFILAHRHLPERTFKGLVVAAFLCSLLCPQYFTFGYGSLFSVDPAPVKFLKLVLQ